MLSRRPLIYLSLPSLALLIGLVWFRRKKAIATRRGDTGGGEHKLLDQKQQQQQQQQQIGEGEGGGDNLHGFIGRSSSDSVPIGGDCGIGAGGGGGSSGEESSASSKLGKSAPINISRNSRSPPIPINKRGKAFKVEEEDEEDLAAGGTVDTLDSVDGFSPVELAGSYENRGRINNNNNNNNGNNFAFINRNSTSFNRRSEAIPMEPKVITASKSPKISPKNAFGKEAEAAAAAEEATKGTTTASPPNSSSNKNNKKNSSSDRDVAIELTDKCLSNNSNSKAINHNNNNNNNSKKNKLSNGDVAHAHDENVAPEEEEEEKQQQQPPTISSPPLSLYSVHSKDSGTGSSPPQSEGAAATTQPFEFIIPEKYVGIMIGRNGSTVKKVNRRFGVKFTVRRYKNTPNTTDRICIIDGEPANVKSALEYIKDRFSTDKYPEITFERVYYSPDDCEETLRISNHHNNNNNNNDDGSTCKTMDDHHHNYNNNNLKDNQKQANGSNFIKYPVNQLPLSVGLVEGVNNAVSISSILNGGHVFLQHPSHPTFRQLAVMHQRMGECYATDESPALTDPQDNSVCVAPYMDAWYRVVIISHTEPAGESQPAEVTVNGKGQAKKEEEEEAGDEAVASGEGLCTVKFLDFGGFMTLATSCLRQIRNDFMSVPFQSTECILSNLRPTGGVWSTAAQEFLYTLTNGLLLQAQVAGYRDFLPEIYLYASLGPDNVVFINQEMVAQGFAEWVQDEDEEMEAAGAVVEEGAMNGVAVQ